MHTGTAGLSDPTGISRADDDAGDTSDTSQDPPEEVSESVYVARVAGVRALVAGTGARNGGRLGSRPGDETGHDAREHEPPTREAALAALLSGREIFPASRLAAFETMPADAIDAAADNTEQVRRHLSAGHTRRLRLPFNLALFSCDHDWRHIASSVNGLLRSDPHLAERLGKLVLDGYLVYLTGREGALRRLRERVPRSTRHSG